MSLPRIVFRHQAFYIRKILPVMLLIGLILSIPVASWLLVEHIVKLANQPLASLDAELILQHDSGDKQAAGIRTKGLVEPFNLHPFEKAEARQKLETIEGVEQTSSALVLWELDPQNTLTVVGLDLDEPLVGLRKVEQLLFKGRFLSSNDAREVVLERHFATLFGHKPGTFFTLAGQQLKIVGLVDFTERSNLSNAAVFLPYRTALQLTRPDASGPEVEIVNQMFVKLDSASQIESVSQAISKAFPGFSLLNKDSLYKNLSAFNQLITSGGKYLVWIVLPLALLLMMWVIKMHRMEFAEQTRALRTIGWSRSDLQAWNRLDAAYLVLGGIIVAAILSLLIQYLLLPELTIGPVLDQGLKL